MADKQERPIFKRSIFSWILRGDVSLQVVLLLLILAMVFLRVVPLEIQKRIVNDVLSENNLSMLVTYCSIYFGAVVLASSLKFLTNWVQTIIGQRALTEMRSELYRHILRLPLSFFRKTQPGSVVTSLVTELATAGNFIGMAIAIPLSNLLTLVAFAIYLIWLNPLLGVVTLSIYPIALFVVPKVQSGANKANKQRVEVTKQMASQITESVSGVHEVHAHGSFLNEEKKYNKINDNLRGIRIIWTLYRHGVKVTNNLFVGVGPVIVFILGGYLMMKGQMTLGSLVAFLSAQEKLYDPWKDLIDFYQVYQDASVRYGAVMQTFEESSEFKLEDESGSKSLGKEVEVQDLDFLTLDGITLLDQVNLKIGAGEHMALVGFSGSGKSTLAKVVGQLYNYSNGKVLLDGHQVNELSKKEIVENIGFVSQDPFIFSGTVDENLLYACRALSGSEGVEVVRQSEIEPSLDEKIQILQQVGLFVDVLRLGLNTVISTQFYPDLEEKIVRLRRSFQENFGQELAEYVEFYEEKNYLYHSSTMDNLIFGTPLDPDFASDKLAKNKKFLGFLDSCNLKIPLLETGSELIQQTVSILGDVPMEEVFFAQTPIRVEEYEHVVTVAKQLESVGVAQLENSDQKLVLNIALRFIPSKHKIIRLQPLLEKLILGGRAAFRSWCTEHAPDAVAFYSDAEYIRSQSILNNIFYGNLTTSSPKIDDRVNQCIVFLLVEEDLLEQIVQIGMNFDVGTRGDNLSGGQQQKLAIARVLLKQPTVLIMDEATSALDNKSQDRIHQVMATWKGDRTVISVIHRLDMLVHYDKVAVMKAGKIVESGKTEDLLADKGVLYELIRGKDT